MSKIVKIVLGTVVGFALGGAIAYLTSSPANPAKKNPEPYSREWTKQRGEQARTWKKGSCYVDTQERPAEFSFEKPYTYVGNIMYVMEVDSKGLLVAQPNPDCKLPVERSYGCEYWFRAMSFDEPFLVHTETHETQCPPQFTRANMVKKLKASPDAAEFQVN